MLPTSFQQNRKRHQPLPQSQKVPPHRALSLLSSSSQQSSPAAPHTSQVQQPTIVCFFSHYPIQKEIKTIQSKVTYCIACDMMPVSTVEKLMSVMDAKNMLPGRKYFSFSSAQSVGGQLEEWLRTHFATHLN